MNRTLLLIVLLISFCIPASAQTGVLPYFHDTNGIPVPTSRANPLPVDATVTIGSVTVSLPVASAPVNLDGDQSLPVTMMVSNNTTLQKLLAPIMLGDGINGQNMLSTVIYGYNGASFDRIRTAGGAIEVKIASMAAGITITQTGPTGYATDPVTITGAFSGGAATTPMFIIATGTPLVARGNGTDPVVVLATQALALQPIFMGVPAASATVAFVSHALASRGVSLAVNDMIYVSYVPPLP